jgi:hypothetical protein
LQQEERLDFAFDLTAADLIAMNLSACESNAVYRRYANWWSATIALVALLLLSHAFSGALYEAFLAALLIGAASYFALPPWWRYRGRIKLREYYTSSAGQLLVGPHTLSLTAEGLESIGSHHRAFRSWVTVTRALITAEHVFLSTVFGNVYILPLRAVAAVEQVRAFLKGHLPEKAQGNV